MAYIIILIIVLAIALFTFLFFFLQGLYFFNFAQNPLFSRKKLFKNKASDFLSDDKDKKWFAKALPKDIIIKSYDKTILHGYEIPNKGNKWVIIIHGYTNNALEMLTPVHKFHNMGFNVLAIDQRAHGMSKGKYSSMGWLERKDILSWIKYLNEKGIIKIVLYGISMGGNTVMMTVGENIPKNVVCAIEDCGFLSIYHQFYNQLKYLHFLPKPVIWSAHFFGKALIKFNIYKADGLKQLQKGKIPMLFIHGESDKLVPFTNFNEAFDNYNGPKDKLIIEDAKHMKSSVVDPAKYWNKVETFINLYIN